MPTNGFVVQSNIAGEGKINGCQCLTFFGGVKASLSQILLSLSASFKCASHMNVPVLGFLWQSNTGNNRLEHEIRFPQQSSSSRNRKPQFNLFCCFFLVVVLFTERCLSRKPTRPLFRFWQQRHNTPTFLVCSRRLAQHSWGT